MLIHSIAEIEVRAKSALTTSWVSGAASPISDSDNTPDTDQDFTSTSGSADKERLARAFTATTTARIISVAATLGRTGTPPGTIKAAIYTDANSLPGLRVGDFSDTVTAADLSDAAGGASQTFSWPIDGASELPSLTAGSVYWIVLRTAGYTYANGVTEIRWRTDANGAVAASEFAKYQESASPKWTTSGADVGADIVVAHEDIIIPLGSKNQLTLEVDTTKGSSDGVRLKVEFARTIDGTYVQEPIDQLAGNVMVTNALEHEMDTTDVLPMAIPVMYSHAKVSVKALNDETDAQAGVIALTGFI